jgi:hypothetical protein
LDGARRPISGVRLGKAEPAGVKSITKTRCRDPIGRFCTADRIAAAHGQRPARIVQAGKRPIVGRQPPLFARALKSAEKRIKKAVLKRQIAQGLQ